VSYIVGRIDDVVDMKRETRARVGVQLVGISFHGGDRDIIKVAIVFTIRN
jgi:hypothetical protein